MILSDREIDRVQGPKDTMRDWFHANFENPCHSCPREDGEYVFIHGGPYDAHDMLESRFGGVFDSDVIEDLADELFGISPEWESSNNTGISHRELAALTSVDNHSVVFKQAIIDVEELLMQEVSKGLLNKFYGMLFVNTITALETYLFDRFLSMVLNDEDLFRACVASSPRLNKQKITVSGIFETLNGLRETVTNELSEITWHNLPTVKSLYKQTMEVDMGDLGGLVRYVNIRHDIVHRNGRKVDGGVHELTAQDVAECLITVKQLVDSMEDQMVMKGLFGPPFEE